MQAFMDDTAFERPAAVCFNDHDLQFVGSCMLLSDIELGFRVHYQGKVVYYNPEPRDATSRNPSQSPRKRSLADDSDANLACDLLLVDNTGPVLVSLWGKIVTAWYAAAADLFIPFVSLSTMRVANLPSKSSWHGACLTTMRALHSTPTTASRSGTTLTMLTTPTSPYLVSATYIAPSWPVCVVHFSSIRSKLKAPFRAILRGVMSDLSEMLLTLQESNKRMFSLVDDAGMWIRCCAIDLTARSRALSNGNDVVLYFGTGRKGLGSSPGMVYFMRDSLVVQVGHRAESAIKRAEISIEAE
jgi:hypothetical protein